MGFRLFANSGIPQGLLYIHRFHVPKIIFRTSGMSLTKRLLFYYSSVEESGQLVCLIPDVSPAPSHASARVPLSHGLSSFPMGSDFSLCMSCTSPLLPFLQPLLFMTFAGTCIFLRFYHSVKCRLGPQFRGYQEKTFLFLQEPSLEREPGAL